MTKLEQHILQNWSELKSANLYVACSGGLDSMVLLHLLHQHHFEPKVLHVNYQLRGEDSDLDAAFVESFCKKNNIPFEKKIAHVPENTNLQEAARNIRYDWFESKSDNNTKIALAHHFDDQIETFFLNLARKSGILGMSCIPETRGKYVRPLLNFTKNELKNYAESVSLIWREDQSNKTLKYRRNLLRNKLIKEMRNTVPNLDDSVRLLIEVFKKNQQILEEKTHPLYLNFIRSNHLSFNDFDRLTSEEKFELFRRLGLSSSQLNELNTLRHLEKGKKLAFNHPKYHGIIHDQSGFTLELASLQNIHLKTTIVNALPDTFDLNVAYLDPTKIEGDLTLRRWKLGDSIEPIGMHGRQLISDIIKDAKIDVNRKNNVHVLHDNQRILWCPGLKISRHALANKQTKEILRCSISEGFQ